MSTKTLTKNDPTITQFYELLMRGIEAWLQAGKLVAAKLDEDPEWPDKVAAAHPEISAETVYWFDRIGRNLMHPRLLVSDAPGHKRMRLLPYQEQTRLLAEPVELLVKTEAGWEALKVDTANLTEAQARQVFNAATVRSPAGQRAWLEDQAAKKGVPSKDAGLPYRVVGKTLVVSEPCKLSARDIALLLGEMER